MRKLAIAGVVLGAGLVLTGCGLGDLSPALKESVQDYTVGERLTELRVDSGSGEIVVNESGRSDVRVVETSHWRGDGKPETRHVVDGGVLALDYTCPDRAGFHSCSVDYKVEVPRGLKVTVHTGSGTITLRRLSGDVRATTGSGEIEAADLSGKNGYAETGSGDIELKYTSAPEQVTLETGSGDATVRLPHGPYAVETETGSGEEKVEVAHDPSARNKVTVHTGSGNASVLNA